MRRFFPLILAAILCLFSGCSSLAQQQGGYTAEGYQWEVIDYVDGDPYCTLTAQRSPQEGSWYCYVDILEREILDVSLVVSDQTVGEPTGYGFYVDETIATYAFFPVSEPYEGDWYLLFTPSQRLFLEDPASYFIGVKGTRNNTNIVVVPAQVSAALDQFLTQWYGSPEAAQEAILDSWYAQEFPFDDYYSEGDLWGGDFWEWLPYDDPSWFEDIFGGEILPDPEFPEEVIPDPELPEEVIPDPEPPEEVLPDPQLPEETLPDPVLPEASLPDPLPPDAFPAAFHAGSRPSLPFTSL